MDVKVFAKLDKITPNLGGVDISCGILSVQLKQKVTDFKELDDYIRGAIPLGKKHNTSRKSGDIVLFVKVLALLNIVSENPSAHKDRVLTSLGTLGGGGHFIEVGVDSKGNQHLTVHTGSRPLGGMVASYYQRKADEHLADKQEKERIDLITQLKLEGKSFLINEELKALRLRQVGNVKDMGYLEGDLLEEYLEACDVCNDYAVENRRLIAEAITSKYGSVGEFKDTMKGVFSTCVALDRLDEAPFAYKDSDTVEIVDIIKPVYNIKG